MRRLTFGIIDRSSAVHVYDMPACRSTEAEYVLRQFRKKMVDEAGVAAKTLEENAEIPISVATT
jgi:hypothetical protein